MQRSLETAGRVLIVECGSFSSPHGKAHRRKHIMVRKSWYVNQGKYIGVRKPG